MHKFLIAVFILCLFFTNTEMTLAQQRQKNTSSGGPCCMGVQSNFSEKQYQNGCRRTTATFQTSLETNLCMDGEVCANTADGVGVCAKDQFIPQTGGQANSVNAGGNQACSVDQIPTAIGCLSYDAGIFAGQVITFGVGIGSGIAFLLIVWGIFILSTSQGQPEGINKGKEIITSAVIGLVFVIMSVTILQIVGFDILGLGALGLGTR